MYRVKPELQTKILKFVQKYANLLPSSIQTETFSGNQIDKTRFEILTYLNALPNMINPHYQFALFLQEQFPNIKQKHILEYDCGYIPSLSFAVDMIVNPEEKMIAYGKNTIPIQQKKISIIKTKQELETEKSDILISFLMDHSLEEALDFVKRKNIECLIQTYTNQKGSLDFYQYLIQLKIQMQENNQEQETKLIFNSFATQIDSPLFLVRKKQKKDDL